ncbi:DNA translocase FtsK [Runella sp. MFBS21]|uniref:DNA translocase FtsK n=1 Tax=Runella sp. MFBS21 TaxID=3034018 RepID=UPI0023F72A9E|nr:DNA translocase FtsK [Runella sp. MFBS21]MDF7820995.1 DNA translocase FtsK [Runella sp. MFBS21]
MARNVIPSTPSSKRERKNTNATSNTSDSRPEKNPLGGFSSDPRNRKMWGWVLVMLSLYMMGAFIWYLFTGAADQSVVDSAFTTKLRVPVRETQNIMGFFGLVLSHYFIFRWFGIAALGFPFLLFLIGWKIALNYEILPLKRTTQITLVYIAWLGMFFGFFVVQADLARSLSYLCGGIGYEINLMFDHYIGWGGIFVVIGLLAVILVYVHGVDSLEELGQYFNNPIKRKVAPPDIEVVLEEDKQETTEEPSSKVKTSVENSVKEKALEAEENNAKTVELNSNTSVKPAPKPQAPNLTLIVENAEEIKASAEEEINIPPISGTTTKIPVVPFVDAEQAANELLALHGPYDPTLELGNYQYPTIDLLHNRGESNSKVTAEELESNKDRIVETLGHFGIGIASIKATIGPTVTLYEIVPDVGVRISKIKGLEDDIALNLAALGIRIIAPMPGKGTIGIELPNKNREMVSIRSVLASKKFQDSTFELPIALGKTISNELFITDLAKMPHLLMAGATGQGKSVGLNVLLASLIYKKHPALLKFVLVDPKKVELTLFNKIERHFLAKLPNSEEAIITDTKKVVYTLNSLCIEMDNRYDLLKDGGVRNIKEYNAKFIQRQLNPERGHRFLPYIVLVIDELADLMMTAGKEVEQPIARLAQLARAIGIHLVVATQRPSVNVITGLIKANFPARLSFRVTSKIDSRTILDTGGAEQLVGMGDMLLSMGSDMIRLQCAFADTDEIDEVCDFIGNQRGYPSAYHLPEFSGDEDDNERESVDLADRDPMFDEAARVIVISQQGSTSLIQRKLKLGYNRAGRIMDQLEAAGVVGAFEGSKAREVLIGDMVSLDALLKNLK